MKKIILFIFSTIILIGLFTACSNPKKSNNITVKEQDTREVIFNNLNSRDKSLVKGTWKNSTLRKITLTSNMGNVIDKTYIGKEVYLIDFPTEGSSLNNMLVYASLDNYKVIGYGYVD